MVTQNLDNADFKKAIKQLESCHNEYIILEGLKFNKEEFTEKFNLLRTEQELNVTISTFDNGDSLTLNRIYEFKCTNPECKNKGLLVKENELESKCEVCHKQMERISG